MLTTYTLTDQQRYQVYRAGTEGPVLLFVHGFPMTHALWEKQFLHFAENYRVIAPDLRGLGASRVHSDDLLISMEQHADDLHDLLQVLHVDEPVVFIGLSMGGYIAWQIARKYPHFLRALVLCHTRVIADTEEQKLGRYQLADQTVQDQSSRKVEEAMFPRLLPSTASSEVQSAMKQMARSSTPGGLASAIRGLAERNEMTSLLPSIAVPTLAISGEHDIISPPGEMAAWTNHIPQSKFVTLPGVGHVSPLESPAAFNQLLSESLPWLTGTMSR